VLLFAADAQVGSGLSWQDARWTVDGSVVTGPDLLARTVYYKVGHHGSHNATLKEKGLELMKSPDLSAFIPTNGKMAKNIGWGQMPYGEILVALEERCRGRVVRGGTRTQPTEVRRVQAASRRAESSTAAMKRMPSTPASIPGTSSDAGSGARPALWASI
jgi:hypothetical protein